MFRRMKYRAFYRHDFHLPGTVLCEIGVSRAEAVGGGGRFNPSPSYFTSPPRGKACQRNCCFHKTAGTTILSGFGRYGIPVLGAGVMYQLYRGISIYREAPSITIFHRMTVWVCSATPVTCAWMYGPFLIRQRIGEMSWIIWKISQVDPSDYGDLDAVGNTTKAITKALRLLHGYRGSLAVRFLHHGRWRVQSQLGMV